MNRARLPARGWRPNLEPAFTVVLAVFHRLLIYKSC